MGKCSHTCSPKKKNPPKYYCKSEGLKFIRAHEGTRTPTTVGHCHLKTARLPITPHAHLFERKTGLEPATPTLGRLCSTN